MVPGTGKEGGVVGQYRVDGATWHQLTALPPLPQTREEPGARLRLPVGGPRLESEKDLTITAHAAPIKAAKVRYEPPVATVPWSQSGVGERLDRTMQRCLPPLAAWCPHGSREGRDPGHTQVVAEPGVTGPPKLGEIRRRPEHACRQHRATPEPADPDQGGSASEIASASDEAVSENHPR